MNLENIKFLFDNQLIATLEKLINNARLELFLVSPFIDLDNRIKDALKDKISLSNFGIRILFGKNEKNIFKSINKESLDFFKKFPNIDIRYNSRLHAKFYLNEYQYLMTSLNLYNYSLANNIEIGLFGEYAPKGKIARAIGNGIERIAESTENFKKNYFGVSIDEEDPIEKLQKIFLDSEIIYKTAPIFVKSNIIKGVLGVKKLDGFNIEFDRTKEDQTNIKKDIKTENNIVNTKKLSAKQLANKKGIPQNEITSIAQEKGFIKNNQITEFGVLSGLEYRTYMGNQFVVFPEDLLFS